MNLVNLCALALLAPLSPLATDAEPTLKVTRLDGEGGFTQSEIEGCNIIKTSIEASGDYLIDGSSSNGAYVREEITVAPGFVGSITISNVNLEYGYNPGVESPIYVDPTANATLILDGNNSIRAPQYLPAIGIYGFEKATGSLTIDANEGGTLYALSGGSGAAGIGGRGYPNGETYVGNITIKGGEIEARSFGLGGAGIGTGEEGYIESINIEGGTVYGYGYGRYGGAGIGSGTDGEIGSISITGGKIIGTSWEDGDYSSSPTGVGIGSGTYGSIGTISISGGYVEGISNGGVSIGSALTYSQCVSPSKIDVSGGIVVAKNAVEGQSVIGIANSGNNTIGDITITGGSVSTESFSETPKNKDGEDLLPLEIKTNGEAVDSISYDGQDINVSAAAGEVDSLFVYLPKKDGSLKITKSGEEKEYQVGYTSSTDSLEIEDDEEPIPSTPIYAIPTITAPDRRIEKGSEWNDEIAKQGVEATDEEEGSLNDRIVVESNPVDTDIVGDYTVTYSVSNSKGATARTNATITVYQPNQAPTITASDMTFAYEEKYDETKVLANAKANDPEEGDISDRIYVKEQNVDTSNPGDYKIVYGVKDNEGLEATLQIKATVLPPIVDEAPSISCHDFEIEQGAELTDEQIIALAGATANDKEDGPLTDAIYIKSNAINSSQPGDYEVVFEVADTHGNLASASCTATVIAKPATSTPGGDESTEGSKPGDDKPNDDQPTEQPEDTNYLAIGLGVGIGLAALAIIAAAASIIVKRRK